VLDELGSREGFGKHASRHARGGALEESNDAVLDLFLERVDAEINVLAPLQGFRVQGLTPPRWRPGPTCRFPGREAEPPRSKRREFPSVPPPVLGLRVECFCGGTLFAETRVGQNLALTVLNVPYSLDSGSGFWV